MLSVAITQADLDHHLAHARRDFRLERIRLAETRDWSIAQGVLRHRTGGFFSLAGAAFPDGGERLYLYQPQSAVTGVLAASIGGQTHLLLQARAEPGTQGIAQFGPTIQSTLANYLALHGGRASPYADPFIRHHAAVLGPVHESEQLDIGERYLCKSKRQSILACDPAIPVAEGFTWVPASLVPEAATRSCFLNTDLRSLLSAFPWQAEGAAHGVCLEPAWDVVRESLARPADPIVLGGLCAQLQGRVRGMRFLPLDALVNWKLTEEGFRERERVQGFAVEFYRCAAAGREVQAWDQPLVRGEGTGYVALHCRIRQGALQVLVQVADEAGLKTGRALAPSLFAYPSACAAPAAAGQVLVSTVESDEGGRFIEHANRYEVVLVDDAADPPAGSQWIGLAELKWFLSHSNLCTIQLRCAASLLLGARPC